MPGAPPRERRRAAGRPPPRRHAARPGAAAPLAWPRSESIRACARASPGASARRSTWRTRPPRAHRRRRAADGGPEDGKPSGQRGPSTAERRRQCRRELVQGEAFPRPCLDDVRGENVRESRGGITELEDDDRHERARGDAQRPLVLSGRGARDDAHERGGVGGIAGGAHEGGVAARGQLACETVGEDPVTSSAPCGDPEACASRTSERTSRGPIPIGVIAAPRPSGRVRGWPGGCPRRRGWRPSTTRRPSRTGAGCRSPGRPPSSCRR